MAALEKMGLIFQPYNSAGRLPTDRGIRVFVDYLMDELPTVLLDDERNIPNFVRDGLIDDILYSLIERLTHRTHEVTFACIPSEGVLLYLGITHLLENMSEGQGSDVYHIVRFLESKNILAVISKIQRLLPKKLCSMDMNDILELLVLSRWIILLISRHFVKFFKI